MRQASQSETEYFRKNQHVAGMADFESNTIVMNPFSSLKDTQKQAVVVNETARLDMRNGGLVPDFELTDAQKRKFKNYGDDRSKRETIIGRILSGDQSALDVTDEQRAFAERVKKSNSGDNSDEGY